MEIECSANEFNHALKRMSDEMDQFPGPVRFDSFIEDAILPVTGWNPAMWVRLGMLIQEGRGK
jgi:hypothetical protein